jgi:hypothetical protein
VLSNNWLREGFVDTSSPDPSSLVWRRKAAVAYKQKVGAFLERLLLLIHLTPGQPARGANLLSIRYKNTIHGHHSNVFIDHSIVSIVKSYHMGYNVTGSTKIIHRYLPNEVDELIAYYSWTIVHFCSALDLPVVLQRRCVDVTEVLSAKHEIVVLQSPTLAVLGHEEGGNIAHM